MASIRKSCVPINELRNLVSYDPASGTLTWLPRESRHFMANGAHAPEHRAALWNSRYAGTPALNSREKQGYGHGDLLGARYKAHRVAWALHYGEWPASDIDHINGDAGDNRITNLRCVSKHENMRNQKLSRANTSGIVGVTWNTLRAKWSAQIKVDGRKHHLGLFSRKADAAAARKIAERHHGFHPNHGRRSA